MVKRKYEAPNPNWDLDRQLKHVQDQTKATKPSQEEDLPPGVTREDFEKMVKELKEESEDAKTEGEIRSILVVVMSTAAGVGMTAVMLFWDVVKTAARTALAVLTAAAPAVTAGGAAVITGVAGALPGLVAAAPVAAVVHAAVNKFVVPAIENLANDVAMSDAEFFQAHSGMPYDDLRNRYVNRQLSKEGFEAGRIEGDPELVDFNRRVDANFEQNMREFHNSVDSDFDNGPAWEIDEDDVSDYAEDGEEAPNEGEPAPAEGEPAPAEGELAPVVDEPFDGDMMGSYEEFLKAKEGSAPMGEEMIDVPALSKSLNIDEEVLQSISVEGGEVGESMLQYLASYVTRIISIGMGPAAVGLFIYSTISGAKEWKQMDKTQAAFRKQLDTISKDDPNYYTFRKNVEDFNTSATVMKVSTVGNIIAGGAATAAAVGTSLGAVGAITISAAMAPVLAGMGIAGLAIGAAVLVADLMLVVGPAMEKQRKAQAATNDQVSNNPSYWSTPESVASLRDFRKEMIPKMMGNPLTAEIGQMYQSMSDAKLTQAIGGNAKSNMWHVFMPVMDQISEHPTEFGYTDVKDAQTNLESMWDRNATNQMTDTPSEFDKSQPGSGFNTNLFGNFIGHSARKQAYWALPENKAKKEVLIRDGREAMYAYSRKEKADREKKYAESMYASLKNKSPMITSDLHHSLNKDLNPKDYADDDDNMAEHSRIRRDVNLEQTPDALTGRHARIHQGAGVLEVDKNEYKSYAGGQKGSFRLGPQGRGVGRAGFAHWNNNPNNDSLAAHSHTAATDLHTTRPNAAEKGISQPSNRHPHAGEDVVHGAMGKAIPTMFTPYDSETHMGGYDVEHIDNAVGAPQDDPVHMVQPGGSQNPFRGGGQQTHTGDRSGISLGDLRTMYALNQTILDQEPLAVAAKKNFMHSLGERFAFD